ncbi:Uma2 family endonuclease [Argonema galeatum]|uniref:Uma2 family endonuclease n=1 Tax=Argonema galeatum TaxID=2942762 RepID=UPI002010DFE7|nr:Uma2 family endonuclease [Argonema galeatum]MCL1465190.1 Uma2 family endonuclease [Argonema galeatum A003/A1]
MITQLPEKTRELEDQRFILPGYYNWEQFKAIEALMDEVDGVRLSYLDGCVEFMTVGENHETIKSVLAILLALYFFEKGIEFIPVGSATREDENKGASFEPDESYYIGERKEHPDLAIEVAITSGDSRKLERYRRFRIPEVWFWKNNQLSVYRLTEDNYEQVSRSEFLPELDLELLVRCVLMPSRLEARREFLNGIRKQ